MHKSIFPISLETLSGGSAETDGSSDSDGAPVNLLGFHLEFLDPSFIENIVTTVLLNISSVEVLKYIKSFQVLQLFLSNVWKLTLSGKVNIFSSAVLV